MRTYTWNGKTHEVSRPDVADFEVAGRVRMLMRDDLSHEAVCVMARDRIMSLSEDNAALRAQLATARADALRAAAEIAVKQDDETRCAYCTDAMYIRRAILALIDKETDA